MKCNSDNIFQNLSVFSVFLISLLKRLHLLSTFLVLCQVSPGVAQETPVSDRPSLVTGVSYSGLRGELDILAPRFEIEIEIDGFIQEDVWGSAAILTGFSQHKPVDGLAADDKTEVLIWYSPSAIHFGVRAFEPHSSVNATLADRDLIENDDHIQILLDTFNDGRTATVFGVNPFGIQSDGSRVDKGDQRRGFSRGNSDPVDLNPDFIYETRGRLTDYGYEIEIRIPFKSLSFQSDDVQSWGINIIRRVQHSGREQTWTQVKQGRASFLNQGGILKDLQGLDRGLVLDFNPVLTSSATGIEKDGKWEHDPSRPELGGNIRWGLTSNLTMNGTVNPDFSQVESDAGQSQYDPRNAVFFPEKRPFFLEGSDNFETPNRLIYTRRIVSPHAATKFTGKVSGTELAFLSAVDSDFSQNGHKPIFNILRIKKDIGGESTIGMAYTDKIEGSDYNRMASADTRIVFRDIYDLQMQGALSFDRRTGKEKIGHLWDLSLRRQGREFGFNVLFKGLSDDLIAGSGFLSRVGTAQIRGGPTLTRFGNPGSLLELYQTRLTLDFSWLHQTFMDRRGPDNWWKVSYGHTFTLRGGWTLGTSFLVERFYYPVNLYNNFFIERQTTNGTEIIPFVGEPSLDNYDIVLSVRTPKSPRFSANAFVILGQDENFDEWASAYIALLRSNLVFRPNEKIRVEGSFIRQAYWRKTDWSRVRTRDIPRLKIEYQLSRYIFFRFVGQYDATNVDALRDDSRTNDPIVVPDGNGGYTRVAGWSKNDFQVDALFSFEPNPGTVIFAGYGSTLAEDESFRFNHLRRKNDGFFLKLSYLFRMR